MSESVITAYAYGHRDSITCPKCGDNEWSLRWIPVRGLMQWECRSCDYAITAPALDELLMSEAIR